MSPPSPQPRPPAGLLPESMPLYAQIKNLLIARVIKGEWGPGEVLPSEMRLAAEYNVHQGTVRKALDEMAAQNLVVRQQGKGTFVNASSMRHSTYHFFRVLPKSGTAMEPPATGFVSIETAPATEAEHARLRMPAGQREVVRSLRVRRFGGVPKIIERVAQPAYLFPGLADLYRELMPETTYGIIERRYRVLVVKVVERLTAVAATEEDGALLDMPAGTPLLEVDRIAEAIDGQYVEWRVSRCLTDAHEYVVELT
ncbi:GntR family transcriptional regulator [Starkeya koreensis]|uniref:GntR family transcriptional regulator n=1 Tax=Ancylobacter koreensis TaxID=266121 RepID=A0ABT0DKI5_9HYPH|nr:GntR family transcriptional regulator [Ancylobacter koreensis]MCK0207792.1 GntR family transcriptional regulator [Ancylobacter koreensis]